MNFELRENFTAEARAQLRATRGVPAAVRYLLNVWAADTVKHVKEGLAGRYLNRRSGALARSVGKKVVRQGEISLATLGTNVVGKEEDVPYAHIQDVGGWIVPRRARALTIPLAGTKGRASDYQGLFIVKTKTGHAFLAQRTGKTGRTWKARFLLVGSVKLPATHWWSHPLAEMRAELQDRFQPLAILATAAQMRTEREARR